MQGVFQISIYYFILYNDKTPKIPIEAKNGSATLIVQVLLLLLLLLLLLPHQVPHVLHLDIVLREDEHFKRSWLSGRPLCSQDI